MAISLLLLACGHSRLERSEDVLHEIGLIARGHMTSIQNFQPTQLTTILMEADDIFLCIFPLLWMCRLKAVSGIALQKIQPSLRPEKITVLGIIEAGDHSHMQLAAIQTHQFLFGVLAGIRPAVEQFL